MQKLTRFLSTSVLAARKSVWRLIHDQSPNATAMFVLGAQRSGTTMLIDCLEKSIETEVLGEVSRAMENFRLRDLETVTSIIQESGARVVVFKPLTDSDKAKALLNLGPHVAVCWAYRRAADRANSAVAKFGSNNLELVKAFAKGEMMDSWQAQGLSNDSLELIRSFDVDRMTPHSAAGLFWVIRNNIFFEQGLDHDERVLPVSYEDLVSDPARIMRGICKFSGIRYEPRLVSSIHSRSIGKEESRLDRRIQELCDDMYSKFHALQERRWQNLSL